MARLPDPVGHLGPKAQRLYDELAAKRGRIDGMYRSLLNHPDLLEHVAQLGTYFRFGDSTLPGELRELAILRFARLAGVGYEWCKHEPVAVGLGLSADLLAQLQNGDKPEDMTPVQSLVYDAVGYVFRAEPLPADLQSDLEKELGLKPMVELVVLCGFYGMISRVITSFDVPLPPGCPDPFAPTP